MNQKIKISLKQKQILMGKLLGDGHLETQTKGKTYRFKFEHSLKQKEYVDWLYNELKNLAVNQPKIKTISYKNKIYKKYWFNTISSPSFKFYANQFYQNKKKVVPKLIHRWLTPLSLAIWFMDDGSIKSKYHKARILNTQGFEEKEISRLINALKNKFGIQCKLRKQKEGYQIMILAESAVDFAKLIKKYLIPSMEYKIKELD